MAYDEFTAKMVRRVDALERALAEKDQEIESKEIELGKLDAELIISRASYRQLMEKAVRFTLACMEHQGLKKEVREFLDSHEVQAWKEKP